ncbi:MAG: hypothetical protein HY696_09080 [Deltaproteobacteria bacterium]|nr:hypothetical protein [Deltaproteobacteria bacterium]
MPHIQIRDVPETLHRRLRALAEEEQRSLSQQALVLLRQGLTRVQGALGSRQELFERIRRRRVRWAGRRPNVTRLVREDRER